MKPYTLFPLIIVPVTMLCAVGLSSAEAQESVLEGLSACMEIQDEGDRYACYDRVENQRNAETGDQGADAAAAGSDPRQGRPTEGEVTAEEQTEHNREEAQAIAGGNREEENAAARTGEDRKQGQASENEIETFGRSRPAEAELVENADGVQELRARIAAVEERVPGRRLITLENGQVWYQTNSKRIRLRPGMEVRIYPSPFQGSYRLSGVDLNGFIQVERVE